MDWMDKEVTTGTSIVAVEFDGGVVIGADSRTTIGTFAVSRFTDKIYKLCDHVYCCISGSAADCQAICEVVTYRMGLMSIQLGEPAPVSMVANNVKQICYDYRDQMSAGMIIAGWDRKLGGQIYSVPLGGMIDRRPFSIGGSGSVFMYGVMDSEYKPKMDKDEAAALVYKVLCAAMWRDSSSGGVVRMAIITDKGVERRVFIGDEVKKFY